LEDGFVRARRAAVAAVLLAALSTSGCSVGSVLKNGLIDLASANCSTSGSDAGITPEMNANAKAIADVALSLGLGQRGAEVGIVVALTESTLVNVGFGDIQNGTMTSSRGLFQQIAAWGPLEDRTNPTKAATMFFTGGQAGQKGLTGVAGWQTMPIPQAAQAVEQSEFTDGSNYAKNLDVGVRIAASVVGGSAGTATACTQGNTVVANGVNVTIPSNQFVAEAVRGKTIQAPTAGLAKGLAAGFSQLGLPYVWGGSPADGGGPDNGCSRGGGALNSCGSEIGFDCSGLTAFVLVAAGYPGPGTQSSIQRATGTAIGWDQGLPGDIIGFPGHVAINLGTIDGSQYILEASDVGIPIHIVKLTRTDHDAQMRRDWTPDAVQ
jgi:cell wall-associated NlpC family hydrolase